MITKDKLKEEYINFINWWDPYLESYEDCDNVINVDLSEMLYNLEEIKAELVQDNEPDSDCATAIVKVNKIIKAFKEAGIKK